MIARNASDLVLRSVVAIGLATAPLAGERVPGERWLQFADPAEAGFVAARLEAARKTWEGLPSSAFLVVADGAVVAAWGDPERRFMCHSVRKSFLSGLYGIYWDRGEIELNARLSDLGIDDEPDPLLDTEKEARILDLLKARSGVFHPAAYAGRTDSRPRGSEGPGRYFAYNNWDFNTLAAILEQETGARVFEAFDEHFGQPLAMEDWRVSDGYYHYERDKSKYPAYPFRMSARDAARFGLLFAREGLWGDERILSHHWVRRSSALYSIDNDRMGYGFMWWVLREPRFERYGAYAALGVGNQMIAVLPEIDLVIVNRANTYAGEGTPMPALLDLIAAVLDARTSDPVADPKLVPLEPLPADPRRTSVSSADLSELVGDYPYPPAPLGLAPRSEVDIVLEGDHLRGFSPRSGSFALYLQPDGSLHEEDSHDVYFVIRDAAGACAGIAGPGAVAGGAVRAAASGDRGRADELLALLPDPTGDPVRLARALVEALTGDFERAAGVVAGLAAERGVDDIGARVQADAERLAAAGEPFAALRLYELNTLAFPRAFEAWNALADAHYELGNADEALHFYERSLELNGADEDARTRIAELREAARE